jgi:hypothetical protein
MVMPWSKGLLFYDIATHFCDSVRLLTGGNFDIKAFSAGELVPAMQSFDAVSKGSAQAGHDWPGYWKGKNEAFVAFASVPFGLDGEGYNIWLYEKGGAEMMNELYGKFNLVAARWSMRPGNGPVLQQTRHQDEDFKGHARADPRLVHGHHEQPGRLGQPPARRRSLPGAGARRDRCGRILFSGHQLPHGLRRDHQVSSSSPVCISLASSAPCSSTRTPTTSCPSTTSTSWTSPPRRPSCGPTTGSMHSTPRPFADFKEKVEIVKMDKETIIEFRKTTKAYIDDLKTKHPDVKKVMDSQEAFMVDFADWRDARSGVTPWPYEICRRTNHRIISCISFDCHQAGVLPDNIFAVRASP